MLKLPLNKSIWKGRLITNLSVNRFYGSIFTKLQWWAGLSGSHKRRVIDFFPIIKLSWGGWIRKCRIVTMIIEMPHQMCEKEDSTSKCQIEEEFWGVVWNVFDMKVDRLKFTIHTLTHTHMGASHGIIVIVVGNGSSEPSSNLGRSCLHFTFC